MLPNIAAKWLSHQVCAAGGHDLRQQGIQFAQLVAAQDRVQQVILHDAQITSWQLQSAKLQNKQYITLRGWHCVDTDCMPMPHLTIRSL